VKAVCKIPESREPVSNEATTRVSPGGAQWLLLWSRTGTSSSLLDDYFVFSLSTGTGRVVSINLSTHSFRLDAYARFQLAQRCVLIKSRVEPTIKPQRGSPYQRQLCNEVVATQLLVNNRATSLCCLGGERRSDVPDVTRQSSAVLVHSGIDAVEL
jgi:hypothetical protein